MLDLSEIIAARTAAWEDPLQGGLSSLADQVRDMGVVSNAVGARELAYALIPRHMWKEPADFHERYYAWLDSIGDEPPPPYMAVWFRGSGKSTNAEIGVVAIAANQKRTYCIYLCRNQDRADDHVGNIGAILESSAIEHLYPALATRAVGKFGSPRGWRRNRLITAGGLIVDALGLDTAVRGVKIEFQRPDMAVLDDVDDHRDTLLDIEKRLDALSRGLLPAVTANAVIIVAQNLVHPDGVVARILDKRTDILSKAIIDGPIPAVTGLLDSDREIPEDGDNGRIRAVWPEGFDLNAARGEIDKIGMTAFRREMQHLVYAREHAMFAGIDFSQVRRRKEDCPDLVGREMWIDPAVGLDPLKGSLCGFIAGGRGIDPRDGKMKLFIEWAHEERMTPEKALTFARDKAKSLGITQIGIETDQGGETWRPLARKIFAEGAPDEQPEPVASPTANQNGQPGRLARILGRGTAEAAERPPAVESAPGFQAAKAGSTGLSKFERWQRLLAGYERGEVIHVESPMWNTSVLETALMRLPDLEPFDLPDASYWLWYNVLDKRRAGWRVL